MRISLDHFVNFWNTAVIPTLIMASSITSGEELLEHCSPLRRAASHVLKNFPLQWQGAKISSDCAPGDHICRHPPTLKSIHGNLPPETLGQVGRSLKLGKTEIGFSPIFIRNPLCLVALQSGFMTLGYMNPFDLSCTTHDVFSDVRLYALRILLHAVAEWRSSLS